MDKNPAKFFDTILKFLSSDYNRIFTIDEVVSEVYKKQIVKNNKSSSGLDGLFADTHYKSNVVNAVMFLNSQGLVAYNEKEKTVFINTKGFVKIKTEGFAKEIQNKKVNVSLQRFAWVGTVLALLLSAYSVFFISKNSDSPTKASNHIDKPLTTKSVPLQIDTIQSKGLKKESLPKQ